MKGYIMRQYFSYLLYSCIIVISLSMSAHASDNSTGTGNELINWCNSTNQTTHSVAWDYCIGYVDGVLDGYNQGVSWTAYYQSSVKHNIPSKNVKEIISEMQYCYPANATRNQLALVVTKYLKDHPESLNEKSAILVMSAIGTAWPCPTYESTKPISPPKHP